MSIALYLIRQHAGVRLSFTSGGKPSFTEADMYAKVTLLSMRYAGKQSQSKTQ